MLSRALSISLVVTAILALFVLWGRIKVEDHNKAVSIAAEYEVLEPLAAADGLSIDKALAILKTEGLRSVVLSEEIAGEFATAGRLSAREATAPDGTKGVQIDSLRSRDQSKGFQYPIYTQSNPDPIYVRVSRAMRIRYPLLPAPHQLADGTLFLPGITSAMFKALSLGIDPNAAAIVKAAGLEIIARMSNPIGISNQGVEGTITWAAQNGAQIFLPQGDQVLGRRKAMDSLFGSLKQNHMLYASPEFAKLGGDVDVLKKAPELVVRLHSAQTAELDKLTLGGAIDRYTRAARERNMRILLIRPQNNAGDHPLRLFGTFIQNIGKTVVKQGGKLEPPHAFTEPGTPRVAFALLALSLAPAVFFLFLGLPKSITYTATAITILAGVAAYFPHFRQYSSLLGAIVMPILAFQTLDPKRSMLGNYALAVGISLLGGLIVASLLSGLPYFIRASEFPGVKVAVFLPIVAVGVIYFHKLSDSATAWKSPITWGTMILSLLLLGALAFMLERTGNDNPAAVSDSELKFRGLLDTLLYVRPRTKSFLIGFPMLFVGIGMLRRWPRVQAQAPSFGAWTALVLMLGAIGATDVVNTLCHIHTPVLLSLARIGIALVIGTGIGAILWFIAENYLPSSIWPRPHVAANARLEGE